MTWHNGWSNAETAVHMELVYWAAYAAAVVALEQCFNLQSLEKTGW